MSLRHRHVVTAIAATALVCAAAPASAAIKCWTNKEGVRECGNVVPPEYAQQSVEKLNTLGIKVDEQERAKTEEERAAAEAAARQAEQDAEKARQRAAADRVLLDTFSSTEDMLLARDGKIGGIESQIKLTENQVEQLEANLQAIVAAAAEQEKQGRTPGEKVEQDIANVRQQIERKQAFIAAKRTEQDEVRAQFDADISRFEELKNAQAESAARRATQN